MNEVSKINVLVFPCGAENAIEIYQALRYSLHVNIIGASSIEDHGRICFPNYIANVPNISDEGFDEVFSNIILNNDIDVVFATHDSVAEKLAELALKSDFHLVNGDINTTRIARSKSETYRLFQDCVWCSTIWPTPESVSHWPAIIKPDKGQGGQGVRLVADQDDASRALEECPSPLLVEYLPREELTVDCFTDAFGRLVWIGPRTRERVRAGIAMRSRHVTLEKDVENIARIINQRMVLRGPWFFQLKRSSTGVFKLLEVSCRISGTSVAQRARGINLPLMTIHDFLGRRVTPLPSKHIMLIERSIQTKAKIEIAYKNVFVDLDDTLIHEGSVVPAVISFIYQAISENKKVFLITRHAHDLNETLHRARISINIFDAIYHITDGKSKADFICKDSIFIDNHFPEREDVYNKIKCLVLDVDAVALLIK